LAAAGVDDIGLRPGPAGRGAEDGPGAQPGVPGGELPAAGADPGRLQRGRAEHARPEGLRPARDSRELDPRAQRPAPRAVGPGDRLELPVPAGRAASGRAFHPAHPRGGGRRSVDQQGSGGARAGPAPFGGLQAEPHPEQAPGLRRRAADHAGPLVLPAEGPLLRGEHPHPPAPQLQAKRSLLRRLAHAAAVVRRRGLGGRGRHRAAQRHPLRHGDLRAGADPRRSGPLRSAGGHGAGVGGRPGGGLFEARALGLRQHGGGFAPAAPSGAARAGGGPPGELLRDRGRCPAPARRDRAGRNERGRPGDPEPDPFRPRGHRPGQAPAPGQLRAAGQGFHPAGRLPARRGAGQAEGVPGEPAGEGGAGARAAEPGGPLLQHPDGHLPAGPLRRGADQGAADAHPDRGRPGRNPVPSRAQELGLERARLEGRHPVQLRGHFEPAGQGGRGGGAGEPPGGHRPAGGAGGAAGPGRVSGPAPAGGPAGSGGGPGAGGGPGGPGGRPPPPPRRGRPRRPRLPGRKARGKRWRPSASC
jgi:hypothetical protein